MLSPAEARRIGVTYAVASIGPLDKEIRTVGQVTFDERRVKVIAPKIDGWVEHLDVDVTGQPVQAGAPLLSLYSPMLVTAQEELLLAKRLVSDVAEGSAEARRDAADLLTSARRRLASWDIAPGDIARIERTGEVQRTLTLRAPVSGFVVEKRVAFIPLLAGGAALVFGSLALFFHDERLVFIKPTALNLAFAVALIGGYALGKSPVKLIMGDAISLSEATWRKLTLRYGLFFVAMAILNEAVWRTQPKALWVWFKFPGLAVLTLLFSFSQIPAILKDAKAQEAAAKAVETQVD